MTLSYLGRIIGTVFGILGAITMMVLLHIAGLVSFDHFIDSKQHDCLKVLVVGGCMIPIARYTGGKLATWITAGMPWGVVGLVYGLVNVFLASILGGIAYAFPKAFFPLQSSVPFFEVTVLVATVSFTLAVIPAIFLGFMFSYILHEIKSFPVGILPCNNYVEPEEIQVPPNSISLSHSGQRNYDDSNIL